MCEMPMKLKTVKEDGSSARSSGTIDLQWQHYLSLNVITFLQIGAGPLFDNFIKEQVARVPA